MHRFLSFAPVQNARIALRSDASVWVIANAGARVSVNRGSGWVDAHRLRLCAGDRIRTGETEVAIKALLSELGVDAELAGNSPKPQNEFAETATPEPLTAPAGFIDQARRNPGTGQIEPGRKD